MLPPVSKKMRDLLEQVWGARVVAWAQPDGDGGELYEVLTADGSLLRADSLPLLIAALAEQPAQRPLALVA